MQNVYSGNHGFVKGRHHNFQDTYYKFTKIFDPVQMTCNYYKTVSAHNLNHNGGPTFFKYKNTPSSFLEELD